VRAMHLLDVVQPDAPLVGRLAALELGDHGVQQLDGDVGSGRQLAAVDLLFTSNVVYKMSCTRCTRNVTVRYEARSAPAQGF
jgi:hypothetical protein